MNAFKKNLVFVITKSEVGGAQKWVSEQKKILDNYFNIYLITSTKGWLTEQFQDDKTFLIPNLLSVKNILNTFYVSNVLRNIKADIVVSNSANAGLYARLSKLFWKHRAIYVSHGWSCIYNGGRAQKIYCLIERWLSYLTDSILCVSDNDRKNAIKVIGIKESKLALINNATIPVETMISPVNYHSGPLRLVFVGRMTYPKRPELLAEALCKKENIDIFFIGDGEYLEVLRIKYRNSGNIHFLGEVKGFSNYGAYDAFILASDSEGLPMSAIEAGVVGLPLLLSNVGGCGELIYERDGEKNGILFRNSIEEVLLAIEDMQNHYDKYRLTANKISHHFNLNNLKDDYINLYKG
ncbi:glycosyltransferase [Citrobacter braakii]|uniref:glycosyltransferase n=1 Tax=Citrobacter braakii TaxID=57706 RepID=UPI00080CA97D|nr:glycosyltransferase [Citrobacter braakii]OCF82127.1 glycosyl transferase family 1 [Citrobacter freundii]WFX02987.1 glycosyltransferase [Citrobacter braakii]